VRECRSGRQASEALYQACGRVIAEHDHHEQGFEHSSTSAWKKAETTASIGISARTAPFREGERKP
jgi:hypothetical protein